MRLVEDCVLCLEEMHMLECTVWCCSCRDRMCGTTNQVDNTAELARCSKGSCSCEITRSGLMHKRNTAALREEWQSGGYLEKRRNIIYKEKVIQQFMCCQVIWESDRTRLMVKVWCQCSMVIGNEFINMTMECRHTTAGGDGITSMNVGAWVQSDGCPVEDKELDKLIGRRG